MVKKKTIAPDLHEYAANVYLICMASVFLLYTGTVGYTAITAAKWHLFELFSVAYLSYSAYLWITAPRAGKAPAVGRHPFVYTTQQALIAAVLLFTALSTVFSIDPGVAFWGSPGRREGLVTLAMYCLSFLLLCRHARPEAWMLYLFGAAMTLCCMVALIQLTGANPFKLYPEGMNYFDAGKLYSGAYLGTVGNTDLLSSVLCLAIPLFWASVWKLGGRRRFFLLIPLALCLFVLFAMSVAGGMVGVLGALLLSLPVLPRSRKAKQLLGCVVGAVLLLGILLVDFMGARIGGQAYELSELMHGHWDDDFGTGRLFIWRNAVALLPERLLLGGGPDTLGLRVTEAFERYDPELNLLIRGTIDDAHNIYLNILLNQGLPALLCWLGALAVSAVQWVRTASEKPAVAICGTAVLCWCIQAFFNVSSVVATPFFWVVFAILCAAERE